jgi:hypothetical protein
VRKKNPQFSKHRRRLVVKRIGLVVFAVVFCLLCVAGGQDSSSETAKNGPGANEPVRTELLLGKKLLTE